MTSRRFPISRSAGSCASPALAVEVLIPAADRPAELTATRAKLSSHGDPPLGVLVSHRPEQRPAVSATPARRETPAIDLLD